MAKITELPTIAPEYIDGTETVAVVKDGAMARADLFALSAAASAAIAAAATAATAAAEATAADKVQTGLDRVATAADRNQTGLDRVATAADRENTGLDAESAAANAASAASSKTQAELAALAAGAPLYTAIPGDFTGAPSPFLLSTGSGTQVYTHNGTVETLVGWLGRIEFLSLTIMLSSTETTLGATGTVIFAGGYRYKVVTTGEVLTTAGGVKLVPLGDVEGWISTAQIGWVDGDNVDAGLAALTAAWSAGSVSAKRLFVMGNFVTSLNAQNLPADLEMKAMVPRTSGFTRSGHGATWLFVCGERNKFDGIRSQPAGWTAWDVTSDDESLYTCFFARIVSRAKAPDFFNCDFRGRGYHIQCIDSPYLRSKDCYSEGFKWGWYFAGVSHFPVLEDLHTFGGYRDSLQGESIKTGMGGLGGVHGPMNGRILGGWLNSKRGGFDTTGGSYNWKAIGVLCQITNDEAFDIKSTYLNAVHEQAVVAAGTALNKNFQAIGCTFLNCLALTLTADFNYPDTGTGIGNKDLPTEARFDASCVSDIQLVDCKFINTTGSNINAVLNKGQRRIEIKNPSFFGDWAVYKDDIHIGGSAATTAYGSDGFRPKDVFYSGVQYHGPWSFSVTLVTDNFNYHSKHSRIINTTGAVNMFTGDGLLSALTISGVFLIDASATGAITLFRWAGESGVRLSPDFEVIGTQRGNLFTTSSVAGGDITVCGNFRAKNLTTLAVLSSATAGKVLFSDGEIGLISRLVTLGSSGSAVASLLFRDMTVTDTVGSRNLGSTFPAATNISAVNIIPNFLDSYTVAGLPSAANAGVGTSTFVSNETGGAVPAFSDGTAWRRVTDRAVVA